MAYLHALDLFGNDIDLIRMKQLAHEALTEEDLHPILNIDCELYPQFMTLALKREIDSLEPYGIGNVRPLFLLRDLEIQKINPVGRNKAHVQLWLQAKDRILKGIAFQQGYLAQKLTKGDMVQVACHLQENHWNGNVTLEIEVADVRREDVY